MLTIELQVSDPFQDNGISYPVPSLSSQSLFRNFYCSCKPGSVEESPSWLSLTKNRPFKLTHQRNNPQEPLTRSVRSIGIKLISWYHYFYVYLATTKSFGTPAVFAFRYTKATDAYMQQKACTPYLSPREVSNG